MKRTVAGAGALAVVIAASGGGWIAGKRVASPAEVAARTKAPTASRITVAVESTTLSSKLITRGLVRYGEPKPVVLAQSTLKTSAPVLTQAPEKGRSLAEGEKAMEIGGRPVFVLEGALPTYRDLRPGDVGVDVDQLKAALNRKGFSAGPLATPYDGVTESAVSAWYRASGYDPFEETEAQKQQLRTARDAAQRANDAVLTARRAVDQAAAPDRRLQVQENAATARDRIASAEDAAARELDRANAEIVGRETALSSARTASKAADEAVTKAERDGGDLTPIDDARTASSEAEFAVTDAEQAVTDAHRAADDAAAAVPDAQRSVDAANLDLIDTQKGVDDARKSVDAAKRGRTVNTTGVDALGNPTVIGQIVISDDEIRSAEAGVRSAEARVRAAEAAVRQAELGLSSRKRAADDAKKNIDRTVRALERARAAVPKSRKSITKAEQAISDRASALDDLRTRSAEVAASVGRAEADLAKARTSLGSVKRSNAVALRQAKSGARIAGATLNESDRGLDLQSARLQFKSAVENESRAQAELREIEAKTGVAVPANELLFFPSLPLRIDDTKVNRGDPISGSVMTVTTARLAVDSSLDVADAKLVKVGSLVEIEASDFNVVLKGKITELATAAGTKGVDPDKVYVEVTPDAGPESNAEQLNGSSVKLTFPVRSTDADVLAVPAAALSVAADGTSRVEVEDDPAKPTRFVTVTPGLAAEGKVAITVVGGAALKAGDLVVVGAAGATAVDDGSAATDASQDSDASAETSSAEPASVSSEADELVAPTADSEP